MTSEVCEKLAYKIKILFQNLVFQKKLYGSAKRLVIFSTANRTQNGASQQ
jgi:hypothetical protein